MPDKKLKYNWLLSLNAGQSFIIKKIYNQTLDENKQQVDSLEKLIYESVSETENDQQVIQRSVVISLIGNHYQRVLRVKHETASSQRRKRRLKIIC